MNARLEEVIARIGSRPALLCMASASDYFGDASPYRVEDGIAIIDIVGPLSNAAWSWGGTTYGDIQTQVKTAVADSKVKGILLNVNSPGGETDNAYETADMIAAAGDMKPIWAVAANAAYSAAYLLASQAAKIYVTPTSGGVGSVGVKYMHMDYSEMLKQKGINVSIISAGDGKAMGNPYEPLDDEDEEEIQEMIDRLYSEFVGRVADGRGLDATQVVALGARLYDGAPKAIAAGLADMPGDLETAWVDFCTEIQRPGMTFARAHKSFTASAAKKGATQMAEQRQSAAEPKVPTSAEIEAIVAQAKLDGLGQASEIADLCAIAGKPEMAAAFISEKKSVADVRNHLLAAKAKQADLSTGVMPGVDAAVAAKQFGTAKPWGDVLAKLGMKGRN
jgi:signal peptide peptidase SppA